jgi:hypothetical protein
MSTSDLSAVAGGSRTGYLIDVDGQEREKEVVRLFCSTPFMFDEVNLHAGMEVEAVHKGETQNVD